MIPRRGRWAEAHPTGSRGRPAETCRSDASREVRRTNSPGLRDLRRSYKGRSKAFLLCGKQKRHSVDENLINGRQKRYSDGAIFLSGRVISPSGRAFRDSGKAFFYSGRPIFYSRMAFLPSGKACWHYGRLICSSNKKGSRPRAASCLWRKELTPQAMGGSGLRRVLAQRLESSLRAASRPCWRPETLSRA